MPSPLLLPVGNVVLLFWTVPGLAKLEGAVSLFLRSRNFYLRPPRGGRRKAEKAQAKIPFLSTPSTRRATITGSSGALESYISIHALRMEGDDDVDQWSKEHPQFLPTPSAWRATEIYNRSKSQSTNNRSLSAR